MSTDMADYERRLRARIANRDKDEVAYQGLVTTEHHPMSDGAGLKPTRRADGRGVQPQLDSRTLRRHGAVCGGRRCAASQQRVAGADAVRWDRQCGSCGYDGQLGNAAVGIEAAHVRWSNFDGPDDLDNGLEVRVLDHKLFHAGSSV